MHHPASSHAPVAPKSEVHTQKVYTFLHEDGGKKRKNYKLMGKVPLFNKEKNNVQYLQNSRIIIY
jgi:hypothetical protein